MKRRAKIRSNADVKRAREIVQSFKLASGLYLIGSLENGVTVYKQQVRAHNLVWALWEASKKRLAVPRIAVLGGGIAGLTAAACILSRFDEGNVTLFEQRWGLCPLQLGADSRWLHPRIYGWPAYGSRAPGASLPVLNWSEGRASDVARKIVEQFGRYCSSKQARVRIYLGLTHLKLSAATRTIQWMGHRAAYDGGSLRSGDAEGAIEQFDIIILAPGFGLERPHTDFVTPSYWRNEQLGQPILDGGRRPYLVSGFGDGALVDLCRLTIDRFRQDTILYELFGKSLDDVENTLRKFDAASDNNAFKFFSEEVSEITSHAAKELAKRIRKDTVVTLHLAGEDGKNRSLEQVFGPYSSFLNRLLLFLLYRCGAFSASFEPLEKAVVYYGIPRSNVVCRYGADVKKHLRNLFVDPDNVEPAFTRIKGTQIAERLWRVGCFPLPPS